MCFIHLPFGGYKHILVRSTCYMHPKLCILHSYLQLNNRVGMRSYQLGMDGLLNFDCRWDGSPGSSQLYNERY